MASLTAGSPRGLLGAPQIPAFDGLVDGELAWATVLAEVCVYKERHSGAKVLARISVAQSGQASQEAIDREARLLDRLAGFPGVPRCRQAGTLPCGRHYLLLDQPAGQPLAAMMVHPVKPELATRIALALTEVLGAVHQQRVVHQGIAPGAVMLTPDHAVALADWSLANEVGAGLAPPPEDQPDWMAYAAPEVLAGSGVFDLRSDVYSVGAVLHALLHGQAFSHQSNRVDGAVVAASSTASTVMVADQLAVPPALEAVLTKALAASPASRFATMGALAGALVEILAGPVSQGSPPVLHTAEHSAPAEPKTATSPAELADSAPPACAQSQAAESVGARARRHGTTEIATWAESDWRPVTWPGAAWPLPGILPLPGTLPRLMSGVTLDQGSKPVPAQRPTRPSASPGIQAVLSEPPANQPVAPTWPDRPIADRRPADPPCQPAAGTRRVRAPQASPTPPAVARRASGPASANRQAKAMGAFHRTVAGVSAVLVLTLGGVAAWWFGRVPPAEAAQLRASQVERHVVVDAAPTPENGLASVEAGGAVVFTWENPVPQPGDTYSWVLLDGGGQGSWQVITTNRLVLPPRAAPGSLCVEVRLVRHSGKVSEPGLKVCQ